MHWNFLCFLLLYFCSEGYCLNSSYDSVCTLKEDDAANQLCYYKDTVQGKPGILTTDGGRAQGDVLNLLTVGPRGPVVMQDFSFFDVMAHFTRERIPERIVHAKGAGAFGYFEVTDDISRYTKAKLFSVVGNQAPLAARLSTVGGESGSADTVRDIRGFAMKMYTDEGIWDLMGLNTPVFFLRDPIRLPNFMHSQRRNPVTHLHDIDAFWDYLSLNSETLHQVLRVFSDRGTPDGYRHMSGHAGNTFKLVNAQGTAVYCKFHWKTDQGMRNLTSQQAMDLTATDPDYSTRDLYNAISNGEFPSWTFYIQVMTFKQAETVSFNPFDLTKEWPEDDFPFIRAGKVVLNRNPSNYFADVEQIAFTPSNLLPGIEPSPDKVLQGRMFAYTEAHRYRLGTNFQQIPVNCPMRSKVRNYERNGDLTVGNNQGGAPNYYPNSFKGPVDNKQLNEAPYFAAGDVARYDSQDDDNFSQPGDFYRKLSRDDQKNLESNICHHLIGAQDFIQQRALDNFFRVDQDLGRRLKAGLKKLKKKQDYTDYEPSKRLL